MAAGGRLRLMDESRPLWAGGRRCIGRWQLLAGECLIHVNLGEVGAVDPAVGLLRGVPDIEPCPAGRLGHHEPIIFLHTGGLPGLFA